MNTIFWIIIGVLLFDYILERFLEIINSNNRKAEIPQEVNDIYDTEEYEKQQSYEQEKSRIDILSSTFSIVLILGMLFFNGFAVLDSYIYESFTGISHIFAGLIFFGILFFASDILSTPFELYN